MKNIAIFGATGAIGNSFINYYLERTQANIFAFGRFLKHNFLILGLKA